jgi:hypothetical protein
MPGSQALRGPGRAAARRSSMSSRHAGPRDATRSPVDRVPKRTSRYPVRGRWPRASHREANRAGEHRRNQDITLRRRCRSRRGAEPVAKRVVRLAGVARSSRLRLQLASLPQLNGACGAARRASRSFGVTYARETGFSSWFKQCRNWVTLRPSTRAARPKGEQQPPWVWHRGNRTPNDLVKNCQTMACG